MKTTKIHPPTYFLITTCAMVALNFLAPIAMIIPSPWSLLGILPLAGGVVISVIADQAFRRVGTTVRPFEASTVLVTDGPFHITRNPMYLGFVLILLGVGILLGSASPFAAILLFVLLVDRRFIAVEERMLADRFGPAWHAYAAKTPRWI